MKILSTLLILLSCVPAEKNKLSDQYYELIREQTGYQLNTPDEKKILGLELDEISGIEWLGKGEFAAVHDEEGRIFIYNWKLGKVMERIRFGKDGDYEDLEKVGHDFYILKSNGHIYKKRIGGDSNAVEYGNPLKTPNDAEGLTYLKDKNSLLIALKGKGEIEDNEANGKAFYLFNLSDMKMKEVPLFTITKKNIRKSLPDSLDRYPFAKEIKIGPSGVAVHPKTNELYIISANQPWLIILDEAYSIKHSIPLSPKIFRQAEGICFSKNGDLYISNEAGGSSANILKFEYKP